MCLLASGCSEAPKKTNKPLVMAGPTAPELGWRETHEPAERAPISLTASDGSGLELVSLHARVVIEDPLAFTELHLSFHNPEPRRREGRFEIVLPEKAAVSRFATRVGERWQEGEVVERRRAQQVYEDFLHRKQDPALLEKAVGNELSMRVFPIEPSADKEIVLSYSEELVRSGEPYRLMLAGLPTLHDIEVDVRVGSSSDSGRSSSERARGSSAALKLYDNDFTPRGDLEVRLPWQKAVALRSGELVLARVAPVVQPAAAPIDGLTVLFDTSASRALGWKAQVERANALLAELTKRAGDFELRVIAFDQGADEVYSGPASGFGSKARDALLARGALGATDLAQALALAAQGPTGHARVLLIGDGVVTAGADDTTALREAVAKLAAHGARRMDVLGEGGLRDAETLRALTGAGLAQSGVVLDARASISRLADELLQGTVARVEVKVAGASWVHPAVLTSVQPGDERLVFVQLPVDAPLQIELVGAGIAAPELQVVPRPLLERAWARAMIEAKSGELRALPQTAGEARGALERRIVELSVRHRVVSDLTALLVLETEQDYARFGIARTERAEILRVGDEGVELVERGELEREVEGSPLEVAKEDEADERWAAEPQEALEAPTTGELAASPAKVAAAPKAPMRETERSRPAPASAAPRPAAAPAAASRRARAADAETIDDLAATDLGSVGVGRGGGGLGRGSGSAAGASIERRERSAADAPLQIATEPRLAARAVVRMHAASGVSAAEAARVLRSGLSSRTRACYERAHAFGERDRLSVELVLSDKGTVADAYVTGGSLADPGADYQP